MLQIIKKGLVRVRTQFRGHIQNICSLFSVYPYTSIQVCYALYSVENHSIQFYIRNDVEI